MADHSAIEWTDDTWNPIRGCSRVSAGCQNCYAETVANRFSNPGLPYAGLIHPITKGWNGQVQLVPHLLDAPLRKTKPRLIFVNSMSDLFHESVPNEIIAAVFGVMAATPHHTYQVLTKRPGRMLAWFNWHAAEVKKRDFYGQSKWRVCEDEAAEHIANLPAIGCQSAWPLRNVWLGVSVENQAAADERIPLLLQTPAAVRWLSCEPLLGPIDLTSIKWPDKDGHRVDVLRGGYWVATGHSMFGASAALGAKRGFFTNHSDMETIDWVVAGGESGTQARPMHADWVRALRDQCAADGANVPFFFKQWGTWSQYVNEDHYTHCGVEKQPHAWVDRDTGDSGSCWIVDDDGGWSNYTGNPPFQEDGNVPSSVAIMGRLGKKNAGRQLDGVEHNAYPEVRS